MKNNKDFNYFKAFVNLSGYSLKAAELLNESLNNFDKDTIGQKAKEMHSTEHSGDHERHEVLNRLVKEFLPPIEREDITCILEGIDSVTDAVEDVLIGIKMFNVEAIRPEIAKFTELIMNCCKSMNTALAEFENFKKSKTLHSEIVEINRLEEVGDELYINGVHNLYQNTKDPVELMVWTEIYRRLEKCCDYCEDVANDIESIVMKNS
jgi:predicted phosphate transport protein (TIGR00153 family)